ncbi:lanthionine synthetase C-like protein [Lentinula novae-zelandiae]|nr:lanthionine synthetase C-like protein [Lentinula novae-zelandiae]
MIYIGFSVFSRLVSTFTDLGPPLDRVGRANLQENLQQIRQNCLSSIVRSSSVSVQNWRPKSSGKTSFLETPVGIAIEVLIDILEQQNTGSSPYEQEDITYCIEALRRALNVQGQEPDDDDDDDGCEVLYGRAGLLYALLRLRSSIARANSEAPIRSTLGLLTSDSSIANVVRSIIIRGRFGASHYASNVSSRSAAPALMWSWHHKRYLGAAHGVAGILHILLMCPVEMIEPYISDILQTIEWLTTYQDNDGNWPTSLKQRYTQPNDLVQWCHGASGMLILFTTIIRRAVAHPEVFPLSTYFLTSLATAIQRAASLVYQKGLLCKGVGLCHGVAGSVYALLAASDAMGLWKHYEHSKVHFLRAIHLAHLATSYSQLTLAGEMTSPDKPWSLYGGVAGMCCAWAEVYDRLGTTGRNLDRLEFSWCRLRSGMPGFDDITEEE